MKIDNLSLLNIDTLYKIVADLDNSSTNILGSNAHELYSHTAITFELSEISLLDYYYLKRMSSDISQFIADTEFNKEYFLKNYKDISKKTIEFLDDKLNSDKTNMYFISNILPVGFNLGKCSITFTGRGLYLFFNTGAKAFFANADENCIKNGKLVKDYDLFNEKITNAFCANFINQFYKYMSREYEKVDIVTDKYENDFFTNYKSTKPILLSLRSPVDMIDFMNDKESDMKKSIHRLRQYTNNNEYYDNEIYLEFLCNTTFGTFLNLYQYLNSLLFTSIESFQKVKNRPFKIAQHAGINENMNWITSINNSIKLDLENLEVGISEIEMIHTASPIKFTIKLTINDIYRYDKLINNISSIDTFAKSRCKIFISKLKETSESLVKLIQG